MNNDLKDILSNSNKDIDNQQLMDYLSNHLSQADTHNIEETMANDVFINDAVEGLQQFKLSGNLQLYAEQLNNDLQKQIEKNNDNGKISVRTFFKLSPPLRSEEDFLHHLQMTLRYNHHLQERFLHPITCLYAVKTFPKLHFDR